MKASHLLSLAFVAALAGCSRCSGPEVSAGAEAKTPFRLVSTFNTTGSGIGGAPVSARFVLQRPHHMPEGKKPGLLLWFHANVESQGGWDDPATLRELARLGDRYHLITVVVREPHGLAWSEGRVGENVKFVDDFVETYVLKNYDVDPHRLYFSGAGGGADFASKILPAQSTSKDKGVPLVDCGTSPCASGAPVWLDKLLQQTVARSPY